MSGSLSLNGINLKYTPMQLLKKSGLKYCLMLLMLVMVGRGVVPPKPTLCRGYLPPFPNTVTGCCNIILGGNEYSISTPAI